MRFLFIVLAALLSTGCADVPVCKVDDSRISALPETAWDIELNVGECCNKFDGCAIFTPGTIGSGTGNYIYWRWEAWLECPGEADELLRSDEGYNSDPTDPTIIDFPNADDLTIPCGCDVVIKFSCATAWGEANDSWYEDVRVTIECGLEPCD